MNFLFPGRVPAPFTPVDMYMGLVHFASFTRFIVVLVFVLKKSS